MNSKNKMLCAFTVLLFIGTLAIGSVSASYALAGTVNNEQLIPAETYGDDRRNEAVNILMYTELADLEVDGEYDHVMTSLIGSLEGKFTYDNLTDYTQLESVIDEFDILLILENEYSNYTMSNTIAGVWEPILPAFVENGGIVICMGFEYYSAERGATHQILNATGLMEIYNPEIAYVHQMNLVDTDDALARNMPSTYSSSSGSVSYDTTDGTVVVEDNINSKAVVVHKIMGKGHVVLLGFDMYTVEGNQDILLRNAILLHRHVVFDNSHTQYYDIALGYTTLAEDLPSYGFSISSMDIFDPAILEACDIFVITHCSTEYNNTEISIIQDFVNAGGALLIVTERVSFGNATDPLMDSFGFARNTTADLYDSDDSGIHPWFIHFMPKNIQMHSTKVGVDVVEVYASPGLIEMPVGAVPLITTDTDGTATWNGVDEAIGIPVAAANLVGAGRIIIFCDNGFVSDDDFDSDAIVNYLDADNEIFTRNAFRWLAGAGISEQTVVFDQSHSPWGYVYSTWNSLANFLMFNGYNVEWMNTFDPTAYEDADILVICDGTVDYNTTEIAYVDDFVAEGGALLLWGDISALSQQVDPIGQEFNLFVNITGTIHDSDDHGPNTNYVIYDGDNIGNHPIMDGVDRIEVYVGNALNSIGTGIALVTTDSDSTTTWNDGTPAINLPVFAATTYNMGRVVFLTDIDLGRVIDGDADGFGCLYDSDNPIFLANVFSWLAENRAPSVEVITPNGGEILNGTITIEWDGVDFDSDPLTYDVFYSDNNGSDWSVLDSGLTILEYQWNTTLHDDSTGYMIRVVVSDGVLADQDDSDSPFELDNFVGAGPGLPLDPTLLLIIGAVVLVVVIVIVIIMKKKK